MPCYRPLQGYRSRELSENGKRKIVFNLRDGFADMPVEVPCGKCIGCRLEKSRQWAMRCYHESKLHTYNSFLTLTYSDENLPEDLSIHIEHLQLFWKRLRKHLKGKKIRYYACGEYGDKYSRPHYHACLFGHEFKDKVLHKTNFDGQKLYTSETLNGLWGKGHCLIGNVTFESAAYVARYITKKISGIDEETYSRVNIIDGEIIKVKPEFASMSRRPAIGKQFFEKYKYDMYPEDQVIMRRRKMKPPNYYDKLIDKEEPISLKMIKAKRLEKARNSKDNTYERLRVKEKVQQRRFDDKLKRSYENGTVSI
jgi:hypothetical protein